MKSETTQKLRFPLNIQLFADPNPSGEGDGNGGNDTPPKTYSEQEYLKLKSSFDKVSSEVADLKKQAKAKMNDDEKKAQEQKEKDEILASTKKELLSIKLSKEFMIAGFDEETTNKIVEAYNDNDAVAFARTLSTCIKTLVENARKEEQIQFQRSSTMPPSGSGKAPSGLDPVVERYIKNKNSNNNSAYEMLFGKKKQ